MIELFELIAYDNCFIIVRADQYSLQIIDFNYSFFCEFKGILIIKMSFYQNSFMILYFDFFNKDQVSLLF